MPKVIGNNVLIRLDEPKLKTKSGVEIVEFVSTVTTPMTGTVLETGRGVYVDGRRIPVGVKAGQKVILPKWAGQMIDLNSRQYVLVSENDILAVLE